IRSDPANKKVKILVISAMSESEEIRKIMALGADDYLEKPFSNEALMAKIERMLG
ncbi:MAG: response regulator, partial [Candidatus Omnitrophica bacterium]|nr:response regulator [Candidatus Omnitrophota bacterium]